MTPDADDTDDTDETIDVADEQSESQHSLMSDLTSWPFSLIAMASNPRVFNARLREHRQAEAQSLTRRSLHREAWRG